MKGMMRAVSRILLVTLFVSMFTLAINIKPAKGIQNPVTVGISQMPQATADVQQRKCFYAVGLFWVFYANGTGLMVGTSTNGNDWNSSATPLGNSPLQPFSGSANAGGVGDDFAVWFDGTYVQVVYTPYAYDNDVYYARGLVCASGSIIWDSIQVVMTGLSSVCWYCASICTDSSGRPWIICSDFANNDAVDVIYSTTTNGTWKTASGFPKVLSGGSSVDILPLTDNKMYAVWTDATIHLEGALYNGSSFGPTENIYNVALLGIPFVSAVACGDNVIVTFQAGDGSYNLLSTVRNYGTSTWSIPIVIQAGNSNNSYEYAVPEVSVNPATQTLYCFWVGNPKSDYIYCSNCSLTSGTWSIPTAWLYEPLLSASEISFSHWCIVSFYQEYGGYIGLEYTINSAPPFDVRFAYLSLLRACVLKIMFIRGLCYASCGIEYCIVKLSGRPPMRIILNHW